MSLRTEHRLTTGDPLHVGDRTVIPVIRRRSFTSGHSTIISAVPVAIIILERDRAYGCLIDGRSGESSGEGGLDDIINALRID